MTRPGLAGPAPWSVILLAAATLVAAPGPALAASGDGVGQATWTPAESTTVAQASRFLTGADSITYRTEATWDQAQADGLARYSDTGLRYTHEANDRTGRLSATGFWATNHPDPAYDRDDDDGDGRWEEAEITSGAQPPEPGRVYVTMVQFSRWHAKRAKGACTWAWDRRQGSTEILSQLSRSLLGEWQAERFTLSYDAEPYPRVGERPEPSGAVPAARCREARPGLGQRGFVATFSQPLRWSEFMALPANGSSKWTAFEVIGSSKEDSLTWTCGGPVTRELGSGPCKAMGIKVAGVTAAVGYLDDVAIEALRSDPRVTQLDDLQDALTGLLLDVGGFGVVPPGLTVNDRYWDLFLAG